MSANTYLLVRVTKFDLEENIISEHFEVHDSNGFVAGPFQTKKLANTKILTLCAAQDIKELELAILRDKETDLDNDNTPGPGSSPNRM